MLTEVLRYLRNFFPDTEKATNGNFTIANGTISLPFLKSGQYYLIEGSTFNDGVHKYPSTDLEAEAFSGRITPLRIPTEVIDLADEITAYKAKYEASPYTSESFGGYSYSKEKAYTSWIEVYKSRLSIWKKI